MPRERNHRLEQAVTDAGLSNEALARRVRETGGRRGLTISTDHTAVSRWLRGTIPRESTALVIAEVLSTKLGRVVTMADIGMAAADSVSPDVGLQLAADGSTDAVTQLWSLDLAGDPTGALADPKPAAWSEVSLRWLIGSRDNAGSVAAMTGRRVGAADVDALRATMDMFADLDNRFGGAHARSALVRFLSDQVAPLLNGRHAEPIRRSLFSAAAEATLLAAWMSYDSCHHGLAQRYFIQALQLAETGGDRMLAGSIMSAMSHQATFTGHYREAADLARAAFAGISVAGTDTLRAQFLAMEARALSRLGDTRACDLAMADAVTRFERRVVDDDPAWIRYFDDAELAAELGHCHRDLNRSAHAVDLAAQSLSPDGSFVRSDFFATMVLADAHAAAGDAEEACIVAGQALSLGQSLKSARCESYLREFRGRVTAAKGTAHLVTMDEVHAHHPLWDAAS